jgi:predicted phage terminase large subunit-like protein
MTQTVSAYEYAARLFEAGARRYPTPGALAAMLDPATRSSPALDLIDAELTRFFTTTEADALEVSLPPQEGKSQRISRRTPEWLLDHDPSLRIAMVSYELDKSVRWGRDIRNDVGHHPCSTGQGSACSDAECRGLHIDIRRDNSAAGRWGTTQGGGVYCVGIGGALTGEPADVMIIDDPVKDRGAAESETVRNSTWDWWESVALPRLASPPKVVLVMTRWHEDDLAGRIAARPSPLKWRRLVIPAIAEPGDILGRDPGTELESIRNRPPGYFTTRRATMSPYVFASIYQQKPTAAEGNFFRRPTFRYWRPAPPWDDGRERIDREGTLSTLVDCWRFGTVDVAGSTKTSADWTVVSAWAVTPEGDLVLLDRARDRVADHDHFAMALPLISRWKLDTLWVEQGFFASTLVGDARDANVPVAPLVADTDKVTRAIPAAGRVHAGRVWFPAEAPWLDEWCDELASFPRGTHDDQVDTLSYAARVITASWTPAKSLPRPGLDPHARAVAEAHRAATGDGRADLDIMRVPY